MWLLNGMGIQFLFVFFFFQKNSNFALIIFKVNVKIFQIGKEEIVQDGLSTNHETYKIVAQLIDLIKERICFKMWM